MAGPEAGTALEWAPKAGPGGTQRRIRGRVVSIPLITPPYRVQFRGYWTAVPGLLSVGELSGLALARFDLSGWTPTEIGYAHSIVDYVFRWLALKFPGAGTVDQPPEVPDGEICQVCGGPVTWDPGELCPDCGDIALPAILASSRRPGPHPAQ